MCDNVVCERECATKLCVKESVAKLCVKESVWAMAKMEGEPGRDANADQIQKTQCKDSTSQAMQVIPFSNRCITNVFGMLFKY